MSKECQAPDYGNWISRTVITGIWLLFFFGAAALALVHFYWPNVIAYIAAGLITVIGGIFAVYYTRLRREFDFDRGGLMSKIHEMVLSHLDWDGQGSIIDIGCGSGALSIRIAKRYPQAQVRGVDYWGAGWDYAKEQCERNAVTHPIWISRTERSMLP